MGSGHSAFPDGEIDDLIESTNFKKQELKRWYAKFIKDYPDGQLNIDQFNEIYGQIYSNSGSSSSNNNNNDLAGHIFRSFDHNNDGQISFKELMSSLSVTTRGSLREKLEWAFQVYDVDQDGSITIDEIAHIVKCLQNTYKGDNLERGDIVTVDEICKMFQSVDSNSDGCLTLDEFVEGIQCHPEFVRMLNGSRNSGGKDNPGGDKRKQNERNTVK